MSNKKRYGLNFDFIILRVKDIEKISKALSLTYDDINDIFFTNIVA